MAWSGLLVVVYHDGAVMVLKSELHFTCHDHRFEISQSYFNVFSAVSYDEQNARVSVVYNDHSLYIWDVRDIRKVGVFGFPSYYQTIEKCIFRLASLIPSSSIPLASGDSKSTLPPWEMARKQ